ncbi:MAG: hypothetical protein DWQ58_24420, partial [Microcystis aeruginosa TA09]
QLLDCFLSYPLTIKTVATRLRGFIFRRNAVTWDITESARMLSQNRRLHLLIAEAELSLTALF